jgi:transglutaminase-like putative cysteine protease
MVEWKVLSPINFLMHECLIPGSNPSSSGSHETLEKPHDVPGKPLQRAHMNTEPAARMTVRIGCRFIYETFNPTPIVLIVRPRVEGDQIILQEKLTFRGDDSHEEFLDWQGNINQRWILQPGQTIITHDALVEVSSLTDDFNREAAPLPIENLPADVLRYLLPSRYCDSDKIQVFASNMFGYLINGVDRAIAICNWVHSNIRYVTGSGRPDISASEIMARGFGVCRDFAHVGIALCRAVNLPARYVTGHLPDIGCFDPGSPMDFHAYFEVYLGHEWCTFDARFNIPRRGRVKIAHGLDAVDGAFSTTYGDGRLASFEVWSYQVNPAVVSIGDPIDISKRLDGTPEIRFV